jgi:hypothetical protein
MPIIAKSSGANFTPAPEGTFAAVCVDVVDLGMLEVTYNKQTKKQHKIKIVWQIDEVMEDGKPFLCQQRYTLSLHEKSRLCKDLEAWRGRAFTDAEVSGFDVETVIGVGCLLNIIHNKTSGSVYANVSSVMKLPKGMKPPAARDYVRVVDRPPQQPGAPADEPTPAWDNHADITDDDVPFRRPLPSGGELRGGRAAAQAVAARKIAEFRSRDEGPPPVWVDEFIKSEDLSFLGESRRAI